MCFMRELASVVFVANAIALWLLHHIVVGRVGLEPKVGKDGMQPDSFLGSACGADVFCFCG